MLTILAATNSLSLALQRKDQDIVNAIGCVRSPRLHLDNLRREGWDKLGEVNEFCDMHEIDILGMDDIYILILNSLGKNLELPTSITRKWIALIILLIG
jgi:hypothetical protein